MRGTVGFEAGQGANVGEGVARNRNSFVVAAKFALVAKLAGNPPDGGMVEQECFGDALQDVDEIIVAADMREFVSEQRLDVFGWKAGESADWHQNYGTEPADDGWNLHDCGDDEFHGTRDANADGDFVQPVLPFARSRADEHG